MKKEIRKGLIKFIITYAGDEIETVDDALKIARMTNEELKKDIENIKEYYKKVHKKII